MSNYLQTVKELSACIAARTPLVVLMTAERDRARSALKEAAESLNSELEFYTDTDGFIELRREERGAESREPLVYIEERLKKKSGLCFALGDVRYLDTDNSFSRKTAGLVRLASVRKSTVVVVTSDPVWQGLGRLGMFIKLDLPAQKEREKQIAEFIALHKIKSLEKSRIPQTAAVLSGYTALQLNIVMNYAYKLSGGFTYENLCEVAMQKDKLFGKNAAVSRVRVGNVHVAGLDGVKKWLARKERIFFAPKDALDKKYISPPRGILMVGVPGCGKSLSAKLIADRWRLPLYRFDVGALFDKYVGESEKNLRLALDYIGSVSPCVLWIDEIEKELYSGGDNDTTKRILGGLLYWLQENSDRVFLVATANDVSKLPPELFRKGRFSETFFVDLPDERERESAIGLYAKLCLSFPLGEEETKRLVSLSEGFSYADIEAAVKTVAEEEYMSGKAGSFEELVSAFAQTVSMLSTKKELIGELRLWGRTSAVPASGNGGNK